jgi:ribosomal protein L35
MKNSIQERIKITKRKKLLRRKKGQSHFLAKKRSVQLKRRKGLRPLNIKIKQLNNF